MSSEETKCSPDNQSQGLSPAPDQDMVPTPNTGDDLSNLLALRDLLIELNLVLTENPKKN